MKAAIVVGGAFAAAGLVALAAGHRDVARVVDPAQAIPRSLAATTASSAATHQGLLYGRVTTDEGDVYEGRLRFGGDEEALWGNYFNAAKDGNPWIAYVPSERRSKERLFLEGFGIAIEIAWKQEIDLSRPFMARFGDIARIDARGRDLRVTLRSGRVFDLDRFGADDLADGVRVWDERHGVVDLDEWRIRTIELLPTAPLGPAPLPLYGTVRTRHGDFTGFIQWDREACLGLDLLVGQTAGGEVRLRFDAIRSIARDYRDRSLVTMVDGREIVLSDSREAGLADRGIYVDDPRYGRVLISWDAFERVDFQTGGTGPAYGDFSPGRPLVGSVTTRSGRRLTGRLVYDLDESETTETLDAPAFGVDYTLPFGLVASIALPGLEERGPRRARVSLRGGEELRLELSGDLGSGNAGILVFLEGRPRPTYVPWGEVEQVDFEGEREM